MENSKIKIYLKKIFVLLLIIFVIYIVYKGFIFYFPFLIGFIISLCIEPLINLLNNKTKLDRKICSIIVLIIAFSLLITLVIFGITTLISEASNLLGKLNFYLDKLISSVENIIKNLDLNRFNISEEVKSVLENSSKDVIQKGTEIIKNLLNRTLETIYSIPTIVIYLIITILATYFITSDKFYILDRIEHHVPRKIVDKIVKKVDKIKTTLGSYLKAEMILFSITFIVYLIGLYILKIIGMDIKYPFLMALLIFIMDVLPILGAGTIVIPWIVILFINNNKALAFSLLGIYILNMAIKQFLEPKLVSTKIGVHPIFTLISMYTGFKLIGIFGLILGPIILIILKNIFSETLEEGIVKTIMEND